MTRWKSGVRKPRVPTNRVIISRLFEELPLGRPISGSLLPPWHGGVGGSVFFQSEAPVNREPRVTSAGTRERRDGGCRGKFADRSGRVRRRAKVLNAGKGRPWPRAWTGRRWTFPPPRSRGRGGRGAVTFYPRRAVEVTGRDSRLYLMAQSVEASLPAREVIASWPAIEDGHATIDFDIEPRDRGRTCLWHRG